MIQLGLFFFFLSTSTLLLGADKLERDDERIDLRIRKDLGPRKAVKEYEAGGHRRGCGYRHPSFDRKQRAFSKIVGGESAYQGEYPWQVAIYYYGYTCGGVIIDDLTVLTAAHCLHSSNKKCYNAPHESRFREILKETSTFDTSKLNISRIYEKCEWRDASNVIVRAGVSNIGPSRINHGMQERKAFAIFVPEEYHGEQNDLAVIILDDFLDFTAVVRPACLPPFPLKKNLN